MKNPLIQFKFFFAIILTTTFIFFPSNSHQNEKKGKLYLNIVWHQHQPSYLDAYNDMLIGPWVRTHGTKDYYDMTAIIKNYPDVHITVDLTSSLLLQLQEYYVERLKPYIDTKNNAFDVENFLSKWKGKTDPWIDLMLKDTKQFDDKDDDYLFNKSGKQIWNCFSINNAIINRFPEYLSLRDKNKSEYSIQDKINLKFFFYLANFDPDFLKGPVVLPLKNSDGSFTFVDLSEYISYNNNGTPDDDSDDKYLLKKSITEKDCIRIVVETYKVLASIIPIHKNLMYNPKTKNGQVEVITTPYYHPILPLLYDTDLMKKNRPDDEIPARFNYPQDAKNQVIKGMELYKEIFGIYPSGMWPAEGSVAEEIVGLFAEQNIKWIATGPHVLAKSLKKSTIDGLTKDELAKMYRLDDEKTKKEVTIVFRDLKISDGIAFDYANRKADENITEFFNSIEKFIPQSGERFLTILLDGENAWESFTKDNDGKKFFHKLYSTLQAKYKEGTIITVTPTEFIDGNKKRGIKPHPIAEQTLIKNLYPGCWFSPDFSTWIGEAEEKTAWEYLLRTRQDLEKSGIKQPDPRAKEPKDKNTKEWFEYKAWEEMYSAEGSDWFWWYGQDQTSGPGGDFLFDQNYLLHLKNVYRYAKAIGAKIEEPKFTPILKPVLSNLQKPKKEFSSLPKIDGILDETIWKDEAGFLIDDEGSAQFSESDVIKKMYFNYSSDGLYFAFDCGSQDISQKLLNQNLFLFFNFYAHAIIMTMFHTSEGVVWQAKGNIVEMFIPWTKLAQLGDYSPGKPMKVEIFVVKGKSDLDVKNPVDALPDDDKLTIFEDLVIVTFECDARKQQVNDAIYIVGNLDVLGNWTPNKIKMYDDGTNGDRTANDGIWSISFIFPIGMEIQYKYTNSGQPGSWTPSEEFSMENRKILVKNMDEQHIFVKDIFGVK